MARICSVCGKKADTLMGSANVVGTSVICWNCYDKITHFSKKRVFESPEELAENETEVMKELYDNEFPESVIEDFRKYYRALKDPVTPERVLPMITTTPSFSGYRILEYKGLVSGEVVLGTGFLSGLDADWADFFGGETTAYRKKIDAAQEAAACRAFEEAAEKGGNAVVGAKIDLEVFARDLICVMVSGTAVLVEKEEPEQ